MSGHGNVYGVYDGGSIYARSYYASKEDVKECLKIAATSILSQLDPHSAKIPDPMTHTLFCWDTGRKSIKPREPKPQKYHDGIKLMQDMVHKLFNSANAIPPCHEADDAVATAVLRQKTGRVIILSGDKDLTGLVGDNADYYCLNTKAILSRNYICTRWGIKRPSQVPIALAILGDASDGIAGIKGYGPVKVKQLFESVTEDMPFSQALETIEALIPDDKRDAFYESLNATMLDPEVPEVPDPAPLVFTTEPGIEDFGVSTFYHQVRRQYEDREADGTPGRFDEREY